MDKMRSEEQRLLAVGRTLALPLTRTPSPIPLTPHP